MNSTGACAACITRSAAAITSLPMPSPGTTAIFFAITQIQCSRSLPSDSRNRSNRERVEQAFRPANGLAKQNGFSRRGGSVGLQAHEDATARTTAFSRGPRKQRIRARLAPYRKGSAERPRDGAHAKEHGKKEFAPFPVQPHKSCQALNSVEITANHSF